MLMLPIAAALAAVATHGAGAHVSPGSWCGGPTWRLMNLSDPDRKMVRFDRLATTVPDIAKLQTPQVIGTRRTTNFQRHTWRLHAVIDRYRIASNGEIVLVLFDIPSGTYMNAYLPNPNCLGPRARDRTGMIAARKQLTQHCPLVRPSWELLGITVDLAGVGFWNPSRTTRGSLGNGGELRPLTNFKIVNGCGIG
jgi:hypothetical protein